jgi:AraC family transcriptional activator of pobA
MKSGSYLTVKTSVDASVRANSHLKESQPALFPARLILESKRLLAHSDLNISEIAYQLGFDDASYFARLFKQIVLTSPREFRE